MAISYIEEQYGSANFFENFKTITGNEKNTNSSKLF